MKKIGIISGIVTVVFVMAGFSLAEWMEYGSVARDEVRQAITRAIPTDVELKRMQQLLDKIDTKTTAQQRIVAKAQIELEDAEKQLADSRSKCENLKSQMASLRKQTETLVSTCSSSASPRSSQRLAILLTSYKNHAVTISAREKAVKAHRDAVAKLTARFNDWTLQRETLRQQLESLKARHAANQIVAVDRDLLSDDELARAIELQRELESRIRVSERIDSDSAFSSFTWSDADDTTSQSIEQQIDAILQN